MQARLPIHSLAILTAVTLLGAAIPSWATNSCRNENRQNFKDCNADAKETFQAAKDACMNRDHQCVEVCRAERYDCRQATGFDAAIAACDATLADAKQACRDNPNDPPGSPQRDSCIDQAQVVAFECRDQAREDAKPFLKQCRKEFVLCARACPPSPSGAPANPAQCKVDAKNALLAALARCLEDYQIGKDACAHRDHGCVEQCRADRETCLEPVKDQLASDVAACNATRDSAIENCRSLYGEGTVERDHCIDNAQVNAFECRDQARENARPGFQSCRGAFKTCVKGCPIV